MDVLTKVTEQSQNFTVRGFSVTEINGIITEITENMFVWCFIILLFVLPLNDTFKIFNSIVKRS